MSNTTEEATITDASVGATTPLTTWLAAIMLAEPARKPLITSFLQQDWLKIERLRTLHEDIGLPIHDYLHLESATFTPDAPEVQTYFASHQGSHFALRALPCDALGKPMRALGLTRETCIASIDDLRSHGTSYEISLWEYLQPEWCGTILITPQGLYAEMVQGSHLLLTQQAVEQAALLTARLTFPERHMLYSATNPLARTILWRAITALMVKESEPFSPFSLPRFLQGYFEFSYHPAIGYRFFDSNNDPFIAHPPFSGMLPGILV